MNFRISQFGLMKQCPKFENVENIWIYEIIGKM